MKLEKETIEKILTDDSIRYLFLVSLISSDSLINESDCIESLNVLDYISENVSEMASLTDKIRKEVIEFVSVGKEIVNQDLKRIKENV